MEKEQKSLRVFGYGLPLVLALLGLRHWHKYGFDAMVGLLVAVALLVFLITSFNKPLLKVLFEYWMKAAYMIGGIATGVILSVLFFTVFSIVGIILRLLRKDLLQLCRDKQRGSYWINRLKADKDTIRYIRQF